MKINIPLLAGTTILLGLHAQAGLPEPGARLYGSVAVNGVVITAADSAIVIEARRTPAGPPIASYRMGSHTAAGNYYSLKLDGESSAPLAGANNIALGSDLYLVVRNASADLDQKVFSFTARGSTARVDFGAVDSDGDGMSDAFELAHFGNSTDGDPNADLDGDGRPNRREFLQGTDPNVADGRHPADLGPADDRIDLKEVTDYILAWKTGGTWPIEPALNAPNIEDYVTRAGALWKNGEIYIFDNDPVTAAPLWWVNPPIGGPAPPTAPPPETASQVDRSLAGTYVTNQPVPVTLLVTPTNNTTAYAVIETPPTGWTVRNLSHEGRWDAANRKIKWGPFFDRTARTLAYEAVPGPASSGAADFAGRGSFDGSGQVAAGPLRMWPAGQIPAPTLSLTAGLNLELRGEPGRKYELLSSPNLSEWTAETIVTFDAQGQASLPIGATAEQSFFRLRWID